MKNNKTRKDSVSRVTNRLVSTGRISKPQKSKRHRKLKAINAEIEDSDIKVKRQDILRKQPNQRPKNDDDQKVSRSISDLLNWKEGLKQSGKKKKKRGKRDPTEVDNLMTRKEKGMTRPLKPVPVFKKRKGETDHAFMNRVERETQAVIQKSKFEDKFKVDVDQLQSKGESIAQKRKGKKKQKELQRLKEKKAKKMEKMSKRKMDKSADFEDFTDHVEFGEVAMEPPSLTSKPRKAEVVQGKPRPGKKKLLLAEIFSQHEPEKRKLGQTLKRKKMTFAEQRMMDTEREKAIELYRDLKNKKMKL